MLQPGPQDGSRHPPLVRSNSQTRIALDKFVVRLIDLADERVDLALRCRLALRCGRPPSQRDAESERYPRYCWIVTFCDAEAQTAAAGAAPYR